MVRLPEAKPKGSFVDCFQSFQNQEFAFDFKTDSKMCMVDLPALSSVILACNQDH